MEAVLRPQLFRGGIYHGPKGQVPVETFKAIARELVEKSAAEEGNLSYSLNVSQADPNCFAIVEFWKD